MGMSGWYVGDPILWRETLTRFQRNVLVDKDGVARLGGLGSAFSLSLPISWSDIETGSPFCGTAPELVKPDAFGLVHARATKATDMFGFAMFAWEVSSTFVRLPISRCSPTN